MIVTERSVFPSLPLTDLCVAVRVPKAILFRRPCLDGNSGSQLMLGVSECNPVSSCPESRPDSVMDATVLFPELLFEAEYHDEIFELSILVRCGAQQGSEVYLASLSNS